MTGTVPEKIKNVLRCFPLVLFTRQNAYSSEELLMLNIKLKSPKRVLSTKKN